MKGNWCNVRRPMELHPGEHAAYVKVFAEPKSPEAYPNGLHPNTVHAMNVHGIELHELDAWVALKMSKQYTAAEAAQVIIRSRKGEA